MQRRNMPRKRRRRKRKRNSVIFILPNKAAP
jgi:hypothetical protein